MRMDGLVSWIQVFHVPHYLWRGSNTMRKKRLHLQQFGSDTKEMWSLTACCAVVWETKCGMDLSPVLQFFTPHCMCDGTETESERNDWILHQFNKYIFGREWRKMWSHLRLLLLSSWVFNACFWRRVEKSGIFVCGIAFKKHTKPRAGGALLRWSYAAKQVKTHMKP